MSLALWKTSHVYRQKRRESIFLPTLHFYLYSLWLLAGNQNWCKQLAFGLWSITLSVASRWQCDWTILHSSTWTDQTLQKLDSHHMQFMWQIWKTVITIHIFALNVTRLVTRKSHTHSTDVIVHTELPLHRATPCLSVDLQHPARWHRTFSQLSWLESS